MASLRLRLGALLYDWPGFLAAMMKRHGWVRFRNRNERLTFDPASGGARCEWMYGSDLHLCNVSPLAGRWLMRRAVQDFPIELAASPTFTGTPRASFVIGHRGSLRLPLLLRTIDSIAAQDIPVECIVVEQARTAVAKETLPPWVRYLHTPIESDALPYNRAAAFNAGARAAHTSLLILHDNDLLVPRAFASHALQQHEAGCEFIDPKRLIFYLDEAGTNRVVAERTLPDDAQPTVVSQNLVGGSVAADRAAYFAIGGFDEAFVGWGGEDNEFWGRASTRRTYRFGSLPVVHLWHAPQPEKDDRSATGRRRFAETDTIPAEERIRRLLLKWE